MDGVLFRLFQSAWNVAGLLGLIFISSVVVAFFSFRYFSTKWLDTKFNERLEAFKHAQQIELEALRYKISDLLDRAIKINLKEYEHLPEVWVGLNSAYRATSRLLGGLRRVDILDGLSDEKLEKYLQSTDYTEAEKELIRVSTKKIDTLNKIQDYREFRTAAISYAELEELLSKRAIFFSEEMRGAFDAVTEVLRKVIMEFQVFRLDPDRDVPVVHSARREMRENGDEMMRSLEKKVRDRLWNAGSVPA